MAKSPLNLEPIARQVCARSHFDFVNLIGAGAFKQTFLVRNKNSEQLALKILSPHSQPERTDREINAMRMCLHPNIVQLGDLGSINFNGAPYTYIVEKFLPGGTLANRLGQPGALSLETVKSIGRPLSEAIEHMAARGLVHRDIKPENILFPDSSYNPVLVDFGLVRNLTESSLTATWAIQGPGTPLFSAPEQLNNEKHLIHWRSDQFSLGVVISYCLIGQHPYYRNGDNDIAIVQRVSARESTSDYFNNQLSINGLDHIKKMVAPWPVQRFSNPALLVSAWQ